MLDMGLWVRTMILTQIIEARYWKIMLYIDLNLQRIQNYPSLPSIPSTDSSIHPKWEHKSGSILWLSRPNLRPTFPISTSQIGMQSTIQLDLTWPWKTMLSIPPVKHTLTLILFLSHCFQTLTFTLHPDWRSKEGTVWWTWLYCPKHHKLLLLLLRF